MPSIETHKRVVDLFDAFKYDITNADHWLWLLQKFSDKYFERRRGRPAKWNESSRARLLFRSLHAWKISREGSPRHESAGQIIKGASQARSILQKSLKRPKMYKNLLKANSEDQERWRAYGAALEKKWDFSGARDHAIKSDLLRWLSERTGYL